MRPLRFLVLAPDLSRNGAYTAWQFGGALRSAGHRVTLAGPASGPPWAPLADELGDALILPGRWGGRRAARLLAARASDTDVVYAFKAMEPSLGLALRLRRHHGVRVALHLDDWDAGFLRGGRRIRRAWWALRALDRPEGELWLRRSEARIPAVDLLTVSTRALRDRFGGVLVRQGVDTDALSPGRHPRPEARARLGLAPEAPMVLFLGTPRLHKGVDLLAGVPGLGRAVWVVGVAAEPDETGVTAGAFPDATLRGPVPFREAAWYLAACDVFVVPQRDTLFAAHQVPAKLLQAMALGCAIVATDVGDAADVLGGPEPAGVLVPPGDPQALGGAIRRLLASPAERARLGGRARARAVAGLGWGAMARTLEPALEALPP